LIATQINTTNLNPKKGGAGRWIKLHHYINITFATKIIAENETKKTKFVQLPAPTKIWNFF
jgi:hypothetical protein